MLPAYLPGAISGLERLTGTARPGASLLVKRPSAHDIDAAMGNWIFAGMGWDSIERENPLDDGSV